MGIKNNLGTIFSMILNYNLTYIAATGDNPESIEVRYEDEDIWLTQKMLATVYGVELNTINYHIKIIYEDNELTEDSTIRNFRIVQKEGNREVSRNALHYNLQMIIAIGFKVDHERASDIECIVEIEETNDESAIGNAILEIIKKANESYPEMHIL